MRKISLFLSVALFATLSLVLSGCGDDEASSPSLTLNIDGTNIKVTTVTGLLIFSDESGHEARTLNLTGLTKNGDYLSIQVTNWDFQNPPANGLVVKKYYNLFDGEEGIASADCLDIGDGVSLCDAGVVTFIPDAEDEIYTSAFDEDVEGVIEITASKGKKVSGTFDVILTGFSNETDIHAKGTFKNVGYRIE